MWVKNLHSSPVAEHETIATFLQSTLDALSTSRITFAGSNDEQAQPSSDPDTPAKHLPADIHLVPQLSSQGVEQTPPEPAAPPSSNTPVPIIDSAAAVSTRNAAPPLSPSTTQPALFQQPPSSRVAGSGGLQTSSHPRSHTQIDETEPLPAAPLETSNAATAAPERIPESSSSGTAQHLTTLSSAASEDWGARKYMEDCWVIQEDARQGCEGNTRWAAHFFSQSAWLRTSCLQAAVDGLLPSATILSKTDGCYVSSGSSC